MRTNLEMIIEHKHYLPSFGIDYDQMPLAVYTLLVVNEQVRDCATYRGIGPPNADGDMIERIRGGGSKILESEAREIFPEIEEMKLRYRK